MPIMDTTAQLKMLLQEPNTKTQRLFRPQKSQQEQIDARLRRAEDLLLPQGGDMTANPLRTKLLLVRVIRAWDLIGSDLNRLSDPYIRVYGHNKRSAHRTRVIRNSHTPKWDEVFEVQAGMKLHIEVLDHDSVGDDSLGKLTLRVSGDYLDIEKPFPIKGVEHVQAFKLKSVTRGTIELGLTPLNFGDVSPKEAQVPNLWASSGSEEVENEKGGDLAVQEEQTVKKKRKKPKQKTDMILAAPPLRRQSQIKLQAEFEAKSDATLSSHASPSAAITDTVLTTAQVLEYVTEQGLLKSSFGLWETLVSPFGAVIAPAPNWETCELVIEKDAALRARLEEVMARICGNDIDFKSLLHILAVLEESSCSRQKAQLQFKAMDKDRDGILSREDVKELVEYSLRMVKVGFQLIVTMKTEELKAVGITGAQVEKFAETAVEKLGLPDFANQVVSKIFLELGVEQDGVITEGEYVQWSCDLYARGQLRKVLGEMIAELQQRFSEVIKKLLHELLV